MFRPLQYRAWHLSALALGNLLLAACVTSADATDSPGLSSSLRDPAESWALLREISYPPDVRVYHGPVFSPDGKTVAVGGGKRGYGSSGKTESGAFAGALVLLYDIEGGEPKTLPLADGNTATFFVQFTPDGKRLGVLYGAHSLDKKLTFEVWNARTRTRESRVETRGGEQKVMLSSRHIAIWNHTNRIGCDATMKMDKMIPGCCFSPDGNQVALGDWETGVRIYDVETMRERCLLKVPHAHSLAFSPDGAVLATLIDSKTIKLWEVKQERQIASISPLGTTAMGQTPYFCNWMQFSRDGQKLFVGYYSGDTRQGNPRKEGGALQVMQVDWKGGQQTPLLDGQARSMGRVALAPDLARLFTVDFEPAANPAPLENHPDFTDNSIIRIWDLASKKQVHTLKHVQGLLHGLALSPDGRTVALMRGDSGVSALKRREDSVYTPVPPEEPYRGSLKVWRLKPGQGDRK